MGFIWRKLFLRHLDIDFSFLKKIVFFGNLGSKLHFWKVALKFQKNDKKYFFQTFFQIHVIFCLDWIWKPPRYVKLSVWWALKGCNNGFLIFDDLGRKSGKILETYDFLSKTQKVNIFFKSQKSMSRYEKMKNRYYEMKAYPLKIFETYYHDKFQKLCPKNFFISIFLHFVKSQGIYEGILNQILWFF